MRIFFLGMAFVNRLVLARILGEEGLGLFYYALSWVDVLLIMTVFGLDKLLVRELASALQNDHPALARGLLYFANRLSLLLSVLVMIIAMLVLIQTEPSEQLPYVTITAISLAMFLLPLRTNIQIRRAAMQGLERVAQGQIPEYVFQPLGFMLLIGSVWLTLRDDFSPLLAIVIYIGSMLASTLLGMYLLHRAIALEVRKSQPEYAVKTWFMGALPLILLSAANVLNNRVDVLMLGSLDSLSSVGIYTTAVQIANLMALILVTNGAS